MIGIAGTIVALFIAQLPPSAAKPSVFGGRYDGLRLLLADRNLTPASRRDFLEANPAQWKRWTVIVVDDPRPLAEIDLPWDQFVRGGGALFIATDRAFDAAELLFSSIVPGPMSVAGRDAYKDRPFCPRIVRFSDRLGLAKNVRSIVGNRTGYFASRTPGWETMAWLPESARLPEGFLSTSRPFLAARQWEAGRIAFMADQGVVGNEMLLEADNCRFAANLIDWLTDGGRRDRVLFFEGGSAVDEWIDPRFEAGRWPANDFESFLALINEEIVPSLNRSDVVNGVIGDLQDSIAPRQAARILGLGSGLLVLLLIARAIMAARHFEQPKPRAVAAVADGAPNDAFSLRASIRRINDDYSDAALRLARMRLERAFGPDWRTQSIIPTFAGSWLERRRMLRVFRRIRKLAVSDAPKRVDRIAFERLHADIQSLSQALPVAATP